MRKSVTGGLAILLIIAIVVLGFYAMGMFDGDDITHVDDLEDSLGEFSFSGGMKGGLFFGYGIINLKNGGVFAGNFDNGRFSGDGAYTHAGGAYTDKWYFDGVFNNGRVTGGAFYSANGSVVSVSRDSTNVSISGPGVQYSGNFNERGQNGAGSFIFEDGSVYSGGFLDGLANGEGELTDSFGNAIYIGWFENGLFNGQGAYYSPDGWSYEGGFKDGRFDGEGRVTDGVSIFPGKWEKGVQVERYE